MRSIRLSVARQELIQALQTLGTIRRRRFSSVVPVWLRFDETAQELEIAEDRGRAVASVPARGAWPAQGATVDLFYLRRAAQLHPSELIELIATEEAIVVPMPSGERVLNLLEFGPESRVPREPPGPPGPEDLPLFRSARRRRQ